jgi:hypothetical protein
MTRKRSLIVPTLELAADDGATEVGTCSHDSRLVGTAVAQPWSGVGRLHQNQRRAQIDAGRPTSTGRYADTSAALTGSQGRSQDLARLLILIGRRVANVPYDV